MKHKLRLLIFLVMTLFVGSTVVAQISEKGVPASFAFDNSNLTKSAKAPFVTPIQFDVAKLKAEDKTFEANNMPLRTAMIIPVELNVRNSGEWTTLANGQQIWTLTINAPGAIATMLYYDEFTIPKGGKLFIYNDDRSHVIGAYTEATNPIVNGAFATEFVAGDMITLEYDAPFTANSGANTFNAKPEIPTIKISGVGYGYNYLEVYRKPADMMLRIGESASCEVNIHCPEGDNWQDQQKGVAKSVTPIGSSSWLCSGTLVNNTSQDMTPFYLTASHCFYDTGGATLTAANWNQITYYFHYESPTCEIAAPTNQLTVVGAQMLVESRLDGGSDGVLLKLNSSIPLSYDLYFNGWDRTNTPATSGVGIHHPAGDIKKISTFTQAASSTTANMSTGEHGEANAHWLVYFAQTENGWGQTEGGSSGSPLFNQNGLVVGTLTGGNSSCTQLNGQNIYGKMYYHWIDANKATAAGVDLNKTLKDYLDPTGTGVETMNGTYTVNNQATADFEATATNIYVLESITYTDHSIGANQWHWTFEGGTPATWEGRIPPAVTYNAAGDFTTTLVANEGVGPQETKTMSIHVAIKGTPEVPVADFGLPASGFVEGFDTQYTGTASPPFSSNWVVQNTPAHVSPNQWIYGNNSSANFNTVDASSVYSAMINWNAAHSDSWLKTANSYAIANGASIEFYSGYAGGFLSAATLNFLISTDDGATWTQLWTAGTTNTGVAFSWTRHSFDLSSYAGQSVKFAWQYVGDDGDLMGIDGVKFSGGLTSQTTLNVGDFLSPVDLSTGTPVLWDWTLPGATPSTSTGQAPRVQYLTAGTYDITLHVKNTMGEDTKTVTGAVTVVDRLPVISFASASKGYTIQGTFGQYIIPNATVDFTDKTGNYPLSWNWRFDGGNPETSTEQNPQGIAYSSEGMYDVSLAASNTAGEQTKTTSGLVKVGFNDPTRIWNFMYGEAPTLYSYTSGSSFPVFGSNNLGMSQYSERFDASLAGGSVSKVDIKWFKTANFTGNITVAVYTDNNGIPGTLITGASATVATAAVPTATSISGLAYSTVTFNSPVKVSGAFHIVITGLSSNNSTGVRYVNIASAPSRGTLAKNTAFIYFSSAWRPASGVFTDLNTSMDVVPYFAYSSDTNADFDGTGGYTQVSNFNPYIPTNGTVNFTDLSSGIPPNSWSWTFANGDPATSTDQNPQAAFTTNGTHNVSLAVTNSLGGTGSVTKTAFVLSNYDAYYSIWNLLRGEAATTYYNWATGNYVSGTNSFGLTDFAERFDAPMTAGHIQSVGVYFYRAGTPSGTLTISIAKDEGGEPGTILATQTVNANTVTASGLRTYTFTPAVFVDGAYFIVVSGFSGTATGGVRNLAICSTTDRGAGGKSTFYYADSNGWYNVADDAGLYLSLNIQPSFAYSSDITAGFGAENGYTRQSNYGQFIPTDASLNFFDRSLGVATEWNWTFDGATPGSSTDANPQNITYNSTGEFGVDLDVKDLAGVSSDSSIDNYVKVGYDTPDKIWNMLPGETGETLLTNTGELMTGSNDYGDKAFGERFDTPLASGYISSVDINFQHSATSGSLTVSIVKEANGELGEVLATKLISVADIAADGYTTVTFDSPVYTDGAFFVMVTGFDLFPAGVGTGAIAIKSSAMLPATAKNTAFVINASDEFAPVLELWMLNNSLSLNIAPKFTYSIPTFSVDGDLAVDRKNIDATVGDVSVTSNVPWAATTTADWVTITNGSGDTDGEFTYTVSDNPSFRPRVAKITVAPAGLDLLQQVIVIRQSSASPTNLTAEFDNNGDVSVNWDDITLATTSAQKPAVKTDSPKHFKTLGEPVSVTPSLSKAKTLARTMNVHSKTDRKFAWEDADGVRAVEQQTSVVPAPAAKSALMSTPAETVVRWDNGTNYDALGINGSQYPNYKIEVAVLFTPADLATKSLPKGISLVKEVEVYIKDLPLDGITLKIRQGNITYKQKVDNTDLTSGSFNTITLDEPFALDNVSDTYIGYEFNVDGGANHGTGMYTAGLDSGPGVAGKSDLVSEQGGAFYSFEDLTGYSLNWNIAAVVETGTLDNYVLYRDGTAIGSPTDPSYLDARDNLVVGHNCYQVSAVFDGLESTLSTESCVTLVINNNDLFDVPVDLVNFPGAGGNQNIPVTVTDPNDYITELGLTYHVNAPTWISYTMSGSTLVFTAAANQTGVLREGTVQVWLGTATSTYDATNGYEIPVSQKSELLASMLNFDLTSVVYNGSARPVSVTLNAAYSGLGAITALYDGVTAAPVNPGTYEVTVNAAAGTNFDAATGLVLGNYTILENPFTIDMLTYSLESKTYNGAAQPISLVVNDGYTGYGNIKVLYNGFPELPVNAGTYAVSVEVAAGAEYGPATIELGDYIITPASMLIIADAASRPYGTPNPDLTVTYRRFAGNDSPADLGDLTISTTAVESSLPGDYPIVVSGAQNPNYDIAYVEGVLTVTKLNQTISAEDMVLDLGEAANLEATVSSGLALSYTSSDPSIAKVGANGLVTAVAAGEVTITITQSGNEIYNAAEAVAVTVTVKVITGLDNVANPSIMVYPNPASKSTPVYVKADLDATKLSGAIITVYSPSGSLVKNVEVTGQLTKVNLPSSAGTYIFMMKGKDGAVIKTMEVIVK